MNIIFVISSPTGVGKTTICTMEIKRNSNIQRVITHTTRSPRENEKDGADYYFVTKNQFMEAVRKGEFVEYALVHGNYYGTSKQALIDVIDSHKDALLAVDVNGAKNIMNQFDNAVSVFILPPSFEVWLRRVKSGNARKDIRVRLKTALDELKKAAEFDYCIINDDLKEAVFMLESIINSQHNRMRFVKQERDELISELKKKTLEYLEVK